MFKISYKMTRILTPVSFWKPIGPFISFISKYTTTTSNEDIHLPYLTDGLYSGTIDWGDGTTSNNSYANRIHTYVSSGTHTITISGQIEGYNNAPFGSGGDSTSASKLVEITQWGSLIIDGFFTFLDCTSLILDNVTDIATLATPNPGSLGQMWGTFSGCSSLVTCPYMDQWDMSGVGTCESMFQGCTNFNQPLNNWDMSNVYSTKYMFAGCTNFNQPLNNWNTSNLRFVGSMFEECTNFNRPLNNWDVSQVFTIPNNYEGGFRYMFSGCTNFNSSLAGWDVSGANSAYFLGIGNMLDGMFLNCTNFNQPLNTWYTSGIFSTYGMFSGCTNFNQPLNNWNMASVRAMGYMFEECTNFDQPLNNWNFLSNGQVQITASGMFRGCTDFNQPLNNWNFSLFWLIDSMFQDCSSFNQPLNNWDTSGVSNMTYMFSGCIIFNQPLNSWDTSNVFSNGMIGMFMGCTVFNRDLSDWCVTNIPSTPNLFESGTPAWSLPKPVWGTCPP